MNTKTLHAHAIADIESQLEDVITSEFKPTLAFIFSSVVYDIENLSAVFTKRDIDILGATTSGEIINDEIAEKSIVVMLTDMNRDYYQIYFEETPEYFSSYDYGKTLATFSKEHFENPAYIAVFSIGVNGESLVEGLEDALQNDFSIFGGVAGDDATMVATYAFTNNRHSDKGLAVLIIDKDKIKVEGVAICGWEPLGATNVITKAEDNIIYTINDKPAVDIFKEFFGEYHKINEVDGTVAIATTQYPIQIKREKGSVLRAPLTVNEEDGSLIMGGPIKKGEEFRFSIAPGFEIIEQTVEEFKEFHKDRQEADGLLLFSCMARHLSLGPLVEQEVEGICELWGVPMAGFFTYGEIGMSKQGKSHYYNETCSLVILKEVA